MENLGRFYDINSVRMRIFDQRLFAEKLCESLICEHLMPYLRASPSVHGNSGSKGKINSITHLMKERERYPMDSLAVIHYGESVRTHLLSHGHDQ